MFRLLLTFDNANFLLKIQVTCTSYVITLTFEMYTQNLELRGMEPAPNFVTGFVDPVKNTGIFITTILLRFIIKSFKSIKYLIKRIFLPTISIINFERVTFKLLDLHNYFVKERAVQKINII